MLPKDVGANSRLYSWVLEPILTLSKARKKLLIGLLNRRFTFLHVPFPIGNSEGSVVTRVHNLQKLSHILSYLSTI